jgi:hypothetical protein
MGTSTKTRDSCPLWITNELYSEIKEVRHAERKDTIKETAQEVLILGLAVKRGEYVLAEEKESQSINHTTP